MSGVSKVSEGLLALEKEYVEWLEKQGWRELAPDGSDDLSAMNLLHCEITKEQRSYLSDFASRWEKAEDPIWKHLSQAEGKGA